MKFNLALELSGRIGEVAIGCGENLLGTEIIHKHVRYADSLMPTIDRLVSAQGFTPTDMDEVYVSIGPGGFTGLRIAVTTAKMLSYSLGAKIIAVPSAMVVAESVKPCSGFLAVCLARKQDRVWSTLFHYNSDDNIWVLCGEGSLILPEQLIESTPVSIIAGDSADNELVQLCQCKQIDFINANVKAESCWRAGRYLAGKGEYSHSGKLSPLYAREPEAVRLWVNRNK